jgi:hypothetical protein
MIGLYRLGMRMRSVSRARRGRSAGLKYVREALNASQCLPFRINYTRRTEFM